MKQTNVIIAKYLVLVNVIFFFVNESEVVFFSIKKKMHHKGKYIKKLFHPATVFNHSHND